VQYTNAFSAYGPLRAGDQGLHYFTLRNGYDPGARYVPGAAAELRHRPRQYRAVVANPGPPLANATLAHLTECHSKSLLPAAEDGLAAWHHRLPPGARLRGPAPGEGDGQYWVVVAGSLALGDAAPLPPLSCAFLFPDEAAAEAVAGAGGAEFLVLQYPRGRAHLGVG
jgi:hypothetical protein